jgi:hypothetical protein
MMADTQNIPDWARDDAPDWAQSPPSGTPAQPRATQAAVPGDDTPDWVTQGGAPDWADSTPQNQPGIGELAKRGFVEGGGTLLRTLQSIGSNLEPSAAIGRQYVESTLPPEERDAYHKLSHPLDELASTADEYAAPQPGEGQPGIVGRVVQGGARFVPDVAGVIATGGESAVPEAFTAAARAVPYVGRVLGAVTQGLPTAAKFTAEQVANLPDTMSPGDKAISTAKDFAVNAAMAGLPVAAGRSLLTRIPTAAAIGAGTSAGISALSGQPQDAASNILSAVEGAAFGAIPHASETSQGPQAPRTETQRPDWASDQSTSHDDNTSATASQVPDWAKASDEQNLTPAPPPPNPTDVAIRAQRQNPSGPLGKVVAAMSTTDELNPPPPPVPLSPLPETSRQDQTAIAPAWSADDLVAETQRRIGNLEGRTNHTEASRETLDFLKDNLGNPQALADRFGYTLDATRQARNISLPESPSDAFPLGQSEDDDALDLGGEGAESATGGDAPVAAAAIESAAHPDNDLTEPTPAQHEANNYKQGHVDLHGLDVTIQVPKGGMRRGIDRTGTPWEREASDHYGHIRGSVSNDGEPIDVYLGPHAEDPDAKVFVIDQNKPGSNVFDESKAMIGYATGRDARQSYDANFPKGLKVFGGIRAMSIEQFKAWVKEGNTKKPISEARGGVLPKGGDQFGISNAAKSEERAQRDLAPLDATGKRDFGTVWERARQALAEDPQAGNRLANDVAATPRALNAEESAVLIQHGAALNNRYDRALKDIGETQKSGDTMAEAAAQVQRRELEEQLQVHDQAARQSGYEQGLGLSIRQALAKRDYSMARQVSRFRAIEGGEIPKGVRIDLEKLTSKIADLNEQIRLRDERIAQNTAAKRTKGSVPKAAQEQHDRLKAELARIMGKQPEVSFARGDSVGGRLSQEDVKKVAARVLRVDAERANVSVVPTAEQLPQPVHEHMQAHGVPADEVEGVHFRGKSYIVADKMKDAAHVEESIFHEHYTHGGLRARYGRRLEDELNRLLKGVGGEQGVIDLARQQGIDLAPYVRSGDPPTVLMEELLAHMSKLTGSLKRVVQEWVGALRNWLRANNYAELAKYNEADLAHVLKQARQAVREKAGLPSDRPMFQRDSFADAMNRFQANARPSEHSMSDADVERALREDRTGRKFDRAETAGMSENKLNTPSVVEHAAMTWRKHGTDSPYFRKWFGESKVKDADGKPSVVHHGTADEFGVFEDQHAGKNTGHMTAPLGHYFTESRAEAEHYAEKASQGVPADERVIDAYLSIKNPKDMSLREFLAIDNHDEARALRARLEAQGYDGIKLQANGKTQWIAFKSEQAKDIGNRGTFDATNPDIRFARKTDADQQEKVANIVKAMARNRVAGGESNPRALLDWMHNEVGGLTGLSRQQLHEIVAGVRSGPKPTRSDLQIRMATIRSQLRAELKKPDEQRNATRQAALRKQIDAIQKRIATGDFSNVKRAPYTYNEDTFALEVQRNREQRKLDALALRREQAQKNPVAKFADFLLKLHRFNILSSPLTAPKLLAAAGAKIGITPLEEMAGSVLRQIPGISRIAALAPRHGAGFTPGAERAALHGAFSAETLRGMRDQLLRSHDSLDELYGDKLYKTQEWTNLMGNVHSALKEPAMLNEFYRSYFIRAQHEHARLISEGMVPEQVDAYMEKPSTQAMLSSKAYADGAAAKMQGMNAFADMIDSALRTANQHGGPVAAMAKLFNFVFPIRKVPLNIVKEMTSYSVGGLKAGIGAATWRTNMTPAQADYIMKNLKQQSVGIALLALGFAFWQNFGGTHQPGDAKRNPNVKPGEAKIGGVEVPERLFHSPAAQTVQIGAGLARIFRQEYGHTHDWFAAGLHSILANYGSAVERGVPYLDTPRRMDNTLDYGRGWSQVAGDQVRSMLVPQFLQQAAAAYDPYKGYRKPKNIAQDLALGIPGLRERVPR